MKFSDNNANKIFKLTKNYLTDVENHIINFKNFCKDMVEDNYPSLESQCYYAFFRDTETMINLIHNNIHDKLFKLQQKYNDKERANVLYPYEKQAIYQYMSKSLSGESFYRKFGCLYAEKILIDGKEVVTIGISICNDKDKFSKNIAVNLAKKRAREYPTRYDIRVTPKPTTFLGATKLRIPYQWMYENEIEKFVKRCKRWFKNETIIYPSNIDFVEFPKKKKKKSDKITNEPMPF